MQIQLIDNKCIVTREPGDPMVYGKAYGKGESLLLHHIKLKLNAMGFDFIKKRMCKDGHLVDDLQQYIRTRKAPFLMLFNQHWAIAGLEEDYNDFGQVTLKFVH